MAYTVRGEQLHCDRHDQLFAKDRSCAGCDTDPGPRPTGEIVVEVAAPPASCRSTVQLEQLLNEDLDELRELRRKLTGKSRAVGKGKRKRVVLDLHAYNTIAKLADATTKVARVLMEIALAREDEDLVTKREKRLRALGLNSGGRRTGARN